MIHAFILSLYLFFLVDYLDYCLICVHPYYSSGLFTVAIQTFILHAICVSESEFQY